MYLDDSQTLEGPQPSADQLSYSPDPVPTYPVPVLGTGDVVNQGYGTTGDQPNAITQGLGATKFVPVGQNTIIPFNSSLRPYERPNPHCSVRQVLRHMRGLDLSSFRDEDGTLDTWKQELIEEYIPEATETAVRSMRTNYDWSKEIWFFDGTGTNELVLPRREIAYVNAVFLRLLPNMLWYRFVRPRRLDGSEFVAIGGIEPPPPLPEHVPLDAASNPNIPYPQTILATGVEDADLYVDTRRHLIKIPPRVLGATVMQPYFNYSFFTGTMNCEVHFAYGYQPTSYADSSPLIAQLDGTLSMVSPGGAAIDWSSGMPKALSNAVARLVYADLLRKNWRALGGGLASMSVDGLSESYGSKAFGGGPEEEEERAKKALLPYSMLMV